MFNDTITLYNQYKKDGAITWYAHVLRGVECQHTSGIRPSNQGELTDDNVSLHIPEKVLQDKYLKPKEWRKSAEKEQKLTLAEEDFFVEGELTEGIIKDSDYEEGLFEYIKSEYDDVYNITSVSWYNSIPHFEVGGK